MSICGQLIIGFKRVDGKSTFRSYDPIRGVMIEQDYACADADDVASACELAENAFDAYRNTGLDSRARFLELCADNLLALGSELLERAALETGLSRTRLEGERARTANQLRLFAELVRGGDWLGLRVDQALPDRTPLPRSDLRQRKIPLGPVAVFGASNFPLAFSAAGGDVAASLAAGCPVIVKGHPSHPGTSELAAMAVIEAAKQVGLSDGVYSHLSGPATVLGSALVRHPAVKAVAFTGSRQGGRALTMLAAARTEPIPVYAEMSSVNPVILLPGSLNLRAQAVASGFVASLSLGVGQFCTNPGLVIAVEGPELERFIEAVRVQILKSTPAPMLSSGINDAYHAALQRLGRARAISEEAVAAPGSLNEAHPAFFSVSAADFISDSSLSEEVFGPSSLLVRCKNWDALLAVLNSLQGQLTATLHLEAEDYPLAKQILLHIEKRVGRILVNGWPTGVEVCHAMVHGGPFPASSDSRTTSVGTLAIERFLRPICYQDLPRELLPAELREISRPAYRTLVDGTYRGPP